MLRADPAVRLGLGSEPLHDFRVATRRMRALLRAARPGLDERWAEGLRTELGWLAGETSAARDLDVLVEEFLPRVERLGEADSEGGAYVLDGLTADRAAARAEVLAALGSPRYFALVERLVAEAGSPQLAGRGLQMGALVRSEYRRMRKAARRAGAEPDDAAMHRLRIAGKRARYAGELAALPDDRQGQAFVRAAKGLQDVLGTHQDAVVAEERLRALAAGADSAVAVAAGRLVEQETRPPRSGSSRASGDAEGARPRCEALDAHRVAACWLWSSAMAPPETARRWRGEDRLRPLDGRGRRQACGVARGALGRSRPQDPDEPVRPLRSDRRAARRRARCRRGGDPGAGRGLGAGRRDAAPRDDGRRDRALHPRRRVPRARRPRKTPKGSAWVVEIGARGVTVVRHIPAPR